MNYTGQTGILHSTDIYKLYIYDRINGGSTTSVILGSDSFDLEYPNISNKFETIRPCGLTIRLNSATASQFIGFYTPYMNQFNVQLYKNSTLIFEGYLNTETFQEDYSEKYNYIVEFVANNSFTLLKRKTYTGGTNTLVTQFDIIKECIKGLKYYNVQYLYIGLSTTAPQIYPASGETIFHKTLMNSYNFYDENHESNSLYTVLENLLKPYCAFITQVDGNLYITDHNFLLNSTSATFKKYNISNFTFVADESKSTYGGDISGYTKNNFSFEVLPSYNKTKLKFSPYALTMVNDYSVKIEDDTIDSTIVKSSDSDWGFTYNYYTNQNDQITLDKSALVQVLGTGNRNNEKTNDMILLSGNTTGQTALTLTSQTYLVNFNYSLLEQFKKYYLKLSITATFRTQDTFKRTDVNTKEIVTNSNLNCGYLIGKLKLGDHYYSQNYHYEPTNPPVLGTWISDSNAMFYIPFQKKQSIGGGIGENDIVCGEYRYENDELVISSGMYIPMFNNIWSIQPFYYSGNVEFKLMNAFYGLRWNNDSYMGDNVTSVIKDIWIKKISIEVVDIHGNTVPQEDYEKIAYFNSAYQEELKETTLQIGDSEVKNPSERGSLYYTTHNYFFNFDYIDFITGHTRQSLTTSLQNLYLRSVLNNYKYPSFKLSGVFENVLISNPLKYYTNNTDANFSGKKLLPTNINLNIRDNSTEVSLTEYSLDTENIVEI